MLSLTYKVSLFIIEKAKMKSKKKKQFVGFRCFAAVTAYSDRNPQTCLLLGVARFAVGDSMFFFVVIFCYIYKLIIIV